jgi:fructokinase
MADGRPRFTIVAFGEVLWDLLPSGPVLGGAVFNLAYRATSLGDRGVIVSRLGRDERGREASERITALGMERGFLQWDGAHPTGTVPVSFDAKGNHEFTITPEVAYDYIEATQELRELVASADCLCFGTVARRNAASRAALDRLLTVSTGRLRFLDLNLRKDCWTDAGVISAVASADVLKLNDQELGTVDRIFGMQGLTMGEKVSELLRMTALGWIVVTLGEGGAFAASRDGLRAYEPGFAVTPVDTIGAGDAFSAGFIHEILAGSSLSAACRMGNALGALVAGQRGATQPIARDTRDTIEETLARGARRPPDSRFAGTELSP